MKHYYILVFDKDQTLGIIDSRDEVTLKDDFNVYYGSFHYGKFIQLKSLRINNGQFEEYVVSVNYKSIQYFYEVDEETFNKEIKNKYTAQFFKDRKYIGEAICNG